MADVERKGPGPLMWTLGLLGLLPFFTSVHRYLPAMFLTYGHEVDYVAVNDRPRQTGQSKYSNLVRALVGIYDLIGVSWLRRRTRHPATVEDVSSNAND